MFLVTWTEGSRQHFLYEEHDDGTAIWSCDPEEAIIFDTIGEAAEAMLDQTSGHKLADLNVVPYTVERIYQ